MEYHPDYEDFSKENVLYVEFGSRLYPTDNYLIRLGGEIDSRTARHAIRVDFFDYDGNLKILSEFLRPYRLISTQCLASIPS